MHDPSLTGGRERGRFVGRENRFVAHVARADGSEVRAYLPNTARLHEVLVPGAEVVLRPSAASHRRTAWTLTRVWDGTWVSLEAGSATTLVADHLDAGGTLPGWPVPTAVRREVTRGAHRFDLELLLPDGARGLVEVKSLSRARRRVAPLSGTPSVRGVSQLAALSRLAADGERVAVVLVVQRDDVDLLDLTADADRGWQRAITAAREAGVHCTAYRCEVTPEAARLAGHLPLRDRPAEALAAVFHASLIELQLDAGSVTLQGRADGEAPGGLPEELPGSPHHLHIITACNPYSAPLQPHINTERNRLLATQLTAQGYRYVPAEGRSPDGAWREPGFAVLDGDVDTVLALAHRFEQHAVYELTGSDLAVRWTDPAQPVERRGWHRLRP